MKRTKIIQKFILNLNYMILASCVYMATNAFSDPVKIVCNTDNPKESLHVIALEKFGELVKKYSGGRLFAQIHYRDNEDFPAIRSGIIPVPVPRSTTVPNLVICAKLLSKTASIPKQKPAGFCIIFRPLSCKSSIRSFSFKSIPILPPK